MSALQSLLRRSSERAWRFGMRGRRSALCTLQSASVAAAAIWKWSRRRHREAGWDGKRRRHFWCKAREWRGSLAGRGMWHLTCKVSDYL